jgi:RNA polymerase sigma factor (sigma-70 family)
VACGLPVGWTDAVPDRPAAADPAELRLALLDALGQLSPRDRAIIVLRYWEDHSIQTVSELLDLSPGVVKVQRLGAGADRDPGGVAGAAG